MPSFDTVSSFLTSQRVAPAVTARDYCMSTQLRPHPQLTNRHGFVLPAALFALVILSLVALVAITTSDDERRSSNAMKLSIEAFYAAESGANEMWGQWNDTITQGLAPGAARDFGWQALGNGAEYHPVVRRLDNGDGGQPMYALDVEGRGRGTLSERQLNTIITNEPASGNLLPWGRGAMSGRGVLTLDPGWAQGFDWINLSWVEAGVCPGDGRPGAGVAWEDETEINNIGGFIIGEPPILENPEFGQNATYTQFGGYSWDDLVARADYVKTTSTDFQGRAKTIGETCITPSTTTMMSGDDLFNLGHGNVAHPCFNYFPIVYLGGGASYRWTAESAEFGFGQGILLVDGTLQLADVKWAGLIMVRGCLDMTGGITHIVGAILVDGNTSLPCSATPVNINNSAHVQWSWCAVQRTLLNNSLNFTAPEWSRITDRSFNESLR